MNQPVFERRICKSNFNFEDRGGCGWMQDNWWGNLWGCKPGVYYGTEMQKMAQVQNVYGAI